MFVYNDGGSTASSKINAVIATASYARVPSNNQDIDDIRITINSILETIRSVSELNSINPNEFYILSK